MNEHHRIHRIVRVIDRFELRCFECSSRWPEDDEHERELRAAGHIFGTLETRFVPEQTEVEAQR